MRAFILGLIALISLFSIMSNSYAESYRCVGMDGDGNKINVLYDEETKTININGDILKVVSGTQGKNGVATENYLDDSNQEVYVSLVVEDKNKIVLRQYLAKGDVEKVVVPLACE